MENKTLGQQVAEAQEQVDTWPNDRRGAVGLDPGSRTEELFCRDGTPILRWQYRNAVPSGPQEIRELMQAEIDDLRTHIAHHVVKRNPYEVYLHDRADGVRGNYTVNRKTSDGKTESWNTRLQVWRSSGTIFSLEEATLILQQFNPKREARPPQDKPKSQFVITKDGYQYSWAALAEAYRSAGLEVKESEDGLQVSIAQGSVLHTQVQELIGWNVGTQTGRISSEAFAKSQIPKVVNIIHPVAPADAAYIKDGAVCTYSLGAKFEDKDEHNG